MGKPRKNVKDPQLDLRYTPSYAVAPLLKELELSKKAFIWESACGENDLVNSIINQSDLKVYGTDLSTGHDFFDDKSVPEPFIDPDFNELTGIITNPPYSMKPQWVQRCFELTENVALLLPVESLASSKLRAIWDQNGGVSVLLMDTRIDFRGENEKWYQSSCNFSSAWFISGYNITPDRILHGSIKDEKSDFKKSCRFLNI